MHIKKSQNDIIIRMLHLNSSSSSSSSSSSDLSSPSHSSSSSDNLLGDHSSSSSSSWDATTGWKVLIYDAAGLEILSPLLTLGDLKRYGITLHMSINKSRDRVPDVPAIYFISPTEENLRLIENDLLGGLYDQYYLNFTSALPRPLLERLASFCVDNNKSAFISKLFDQYADFVASEDTLFTLPPQSSDSFFSLNNPKLSEDSIMASLDRVVDSLFSLCVTMGSVPIIRARMGEGAERVAIKLENKLREHLNSRNNLFTNSSGIGGGGPLSITSSNRPLLILLDRSIDLSAPLQHTWTYQALLNDLLKMQANRVHISLPDTATTATGINQKLKQYTYELNSTDDVFWRQNTNKPFPKVAESVEEKLKQYQAQVASIKEKTGVNLLDEGAANNATSQLATAISSLPKLQKKKKLLDMHTNLLTALLQQIKVREIDAFFELELQWMNKTNIEKASLLSLLSGEGGGKGSYRDKLRALIIYYLNADAVPEDQLNEFRQTLEKFIDKSREKDNNNNSTNKPSSSSSTPATISLTEKEKQELYSINFIKSFRFIHRLGNDSAAVARNVAASASASASKATSMFHKLANTVYGQGVGLLAGVRNLLPANTDLPLTKIVDALVQQKETIDTEKYLFLDARAPKGKGRSYTRPQGVYSNSIVYVLGGASYVEYQNLQDYAHRNQEKGVTTIAYGGTELVSPEQFLAQLAALGSVEAGNNSGVAVD